MSYTDPKTWADYEIVPASDFNTYIRDNVTWLYNQLPTNHFTRFRNYISWLSLDGFTATLTGNATAVAKGLYLYLTTPTAATGTSHVISKGSLGNAFCAEDKAINCEWSFGGCAAVTDQTVKLLLTTVTTAPAPDNDIQFGFKIVNADINSITGDGSDNELTDTGVNISTGRTITRLRAVFTPGSKCEFYIDGDLVTTHLTHLPAAASDFYLAGMITSGAATIKDLYLQRFLIEREY